MNLNEEERLRAFSPEDLPDVFWDTLKQAKKNPEKLAQILTSLTKREVIEFMNHFVEAMANLDDEPFVSIINSQTTEDTFEELRIWVVSQGLQFYSEIWLDPKVFPKSLSEINEEESLIGVVEEVFYQRYNENIYDFID